MNAQSLLLRFVLLFQLARTLSAETPHSESSFPTQSSAETHQLACETPESLMLAYSHDETQFSPSVS
jgi:hypothetical protein